MKILITGGAGFIGSHLVDRLIKKGNTVVIIDNLSTGDKRNINKKAIFYKMDICDVNMGKIFKKEKPKIVFHFAAKVDVKKSIDNPMEDAKTNILGSINVLENCAKCNVKKVIFSSTGGGIYGEADSIPTSENYPANPISPYGLSKLTVEHYLNYYNRVFKIPFVSLRLANVYGPRQSPRSESGVMAIFCHNIFCGRDLKINGTGRQTRDFVYVEDAVRSSMLAMQTKKTGVFNIATARETSINAVFNLVKKESGLHCKKIHIKSRKGEQKRSCLSYLKFKKAFNWQPQYSLKQGVKNTIAWYKSN